MDQLVTSTQPANGEKTETTDEITMPRETFNQRLQQAERAGIRKFLESAGLTKETSAAQLKNLLAYAAEAKEQGTGDMNSELEARYQNRIQNLENHIEELQRKKEEELQRERQLREQIVVREALLRAYLENNGLPAEINANAQETALRDMISIPGVEFVVNEDNSVSVRDNQGNSMYRDGQPMTLSSWVREYLSSRPYLVRSSGKGTGFGSIDKPLSALDSGEIRSAASDRQQRLELGRSLT
jgi:hypothetical protein